ncbi:histidine kinase [uncultured Serinicoccus sp.]|uniref:sensor histidine kinase n=1 Tax=uncultured Serinicoccus sp. TaxID=735514 RepID=UPI00262BB129|nr:histidine kinase [uncultured Serinicoccus sp.]
MARSTTVFDAVLALGCTLIAVTVHRSHLDGVDANRTSDLVSTALTVIAVAPLASRRSRPLAALAACSIGLLGLMAGEYVVAVAPVGVLIAFYSVTAWGTVRAARHGLVVVAAVVVATALLRPVDLSLEGVAVNGALLVVGLVLGTGVKERRLLHEAQVAAALRDLDLERERADRASLEERLRISRELHDVLGHAMSVMVVQAGVAQHLLSARPDEAAAALARIADTGRSSMHELRRLLSVIREGDPSTHSAHGLVGLDDLPALASGMAAAGLPVALDCSIDGDVPAGIELAAYRIIQEALTNTLRHAGSATVSVTLQRRGDDLLIDIVDDGRGGAPSVRGSGRGLAGMRERVAVYGGELTTGPRRLGGYRVHARIPLNAQPHDAVPSQNAVPA